MIRKRAVLDTEHPPGQVLYEREAKKWPKPSCWDNLLEGTRALWEERAMKKKNVRLVDKSVCLSDEENQKLITWGDN